MKRKLDILDIDRPDIPAEPVLPGACAAGGCGCSEPALPPPPSFGEVRVNGVEILPETIAQEIQHHPAPDAETAWTEAARALAVRELLMQEAVRLDLAPEAETDEQGRSEDDEEALIRVLLEQEIVPERPARNECLRYYEANAARFRTSDLFEASHILIEPERQDDAAWDEALARARTIAAQVALLVDQLAGIGRAGDCRHDLPGDLRAGRALRACPSTVAPSHAPVRAYIVPMANRPFRLSRRTLMISGAAVAAGALTRSTPGFLAGDSRHETASLPVNAAEKPVTSLSPALLRRALSALDRHAKAIPLRDRIAIVDFSAPSSEARLHFLDVVNGEASRLLVAHGTGSDPDHTGFLQRFSNVFDSNASSEGAFRTGDYYVGKHGRSQRLVGLDATNNNALDRAIVIHGAWYANAGMIEAHGKLGRSQGCFAVGENDLRRVFDHLGKGRLLYAAKA